MKICCIFNPHSGRNRHHPDRANGIRRLIDRQRLEAQLQLTDGPGHAVELARTAQARGFDRVVAIGGDGTLNEVITPLLDTDITVGLVPAGSGNGLARHLGLPSRFSSAWELATAAQSRPVVVDAGAVNGRPFCNVMGVGFDAEVAHRFNRLEKRGFFNYARVTADSLRRLRPLRCTLHQGDTALTVEALLVAIANSSQYGNNARIAPPAQIDDGLLDLIALQSDSLPQALSLLPSLFLGNLHRRRGVLHRQASRFVIERAGPGLVHTDGETFEGPDRLEIVVRPQSLRVIAPPRHNGRAATGPEPVAAHLYES